MPCTKSRIGYPAFLPLVLIILSCSAGDALRPFERVPGDVEPVVEQFVVLVNQHRVSIGCPALKWDSNVAAVAEAHSQDMVDRAFFSHTNPDGKTPGNRLDDADIEWSRWAENIAGGYATAEAVLDAWLNSAGHRHNIETCALTHHGVGLVNGYWTHVFITP